MIFPHLLHEKGSEPFTRVPGEGGADLPILKSDNLSVSSELQSESTISDPLWLGRRSQFTCIRTSLVRSD